MHEVMMNFSVHSPHTHVAGKTGVVGGRVEARRTSYTRLEGGHSLQCQFMQWA